MSAIQPPPPHWTRGSPPPPAPPGPAPSANYRMATGTGLGQSRSVSTVSRSPGLMDPASEDLSRSQQYFKNGVDLLVEEGRLRQSLGDSYTRPSEVLSMVPTRKQFELDDVHLKTLQTIFTLLDSDQDGMLDIDQLRTAIIAMGIPPSQRLIQEILSNVPDFRKAGRGGVDFNTFKTVVTGRLQSNPVHMADINELFKVFESSDGEGYISDHHLRHVMEVKTTNNTNLSDDEVDEIFKELRIDRRAEIDYREFLAKISSGFVNFE